MVLLTTDYRVEAERPVRDRDNNPSEKQAVEQVSRGLIETPFGRQIKQGSLIIIRYGVGEEERRQR